MRRSNAALKKAVMNGATPACTAGLASHSWIMRTPPAPSETRRVRGDMHSAYTCSEIMSYGGRSAEFLGGSFLPKKHANDRIAELREAHHKVSSSAGQQPLRA